MPFDPTKPANASPNSSAEMRGQLAALKSLIDAIPAGPPGPSGADGADGADGAAGEVSQAQLTSAIMDTAHNPTGVQPLSLTLSDPPTTQETQAILDKLNELITTLRREP